jgi:hypothetical protein
LLVVFLAVTYTTFPETRGYSLEEIAEVFDGPSAVPDAAAAERKLSEIGYDEQIEQRGGKA